MIKKLTVAILGSTGYVGLELVKILSRHPNVLINFLGSENSPNKKISDFDSSLKVFKLPNIDLNINFNPKNSDVVFLALPHGISHKYVKNFFNKLKIIDLSADFRLNNIQTYYDNYDNEHSCPEILQSFIYGLAEINRSHLENSSNIAVPGCYPTSVLLPLILLLQNNIIDSKNIIIDSKSGYSGAGKRFDIRNIKNKFDLNFYNYNTNTHRHICEIKQEMNNISKSKVSFSFNPHILPNFRGMMSTIYCNLINNKNRKDVIKLFYNFAESNPFIKLFNDETQADFFSVQNTNNCIIKIFNHIDEDKIIIVSLIDNLIKGAAGQAVQCLNISYGFDETIGLKK